MKPDKSFRELDKILLKLFKAGFAQGEGTTPQYSRTEANQDIINLILAQLPKEVRLYEGREDAQAGQRIGYNRAIKEIRKVIKGEQE